MQRDYKHRVGSSHQTRTNAKSRKAIKRKSAAKKPTNAATSKPTVAGWRWALVFTIITAFAYFLYSLATSQQPQKPNTPIAKPRSQEVKPLSLAKTPVKQAKNTVVAKKAPVAKAKQEIQYDFYTVLPEAEFVIPDHEVKTRKREERVGKAKTGVQYSVQAGAFRKFKDADSLKAKLLMMGFSPNIEKAVIGSTTWYRVKMGPYNQLASVDAIQARLKSNKMKALVIEVKK